MAPPWKPDNGEMKQSMEMDLDNFDPEPGVRNSENRVDEDMGQEAAHETEGEQQEATHEPDGEQDVRREAGEEEADGLRPRMRRQPDQPTRKDIQEHELTHIPYRFHKDFHFAIYVLCCNAAHVLCCNR